MQVSELRRDKKMNKEFSSVVVIGGTSVLAQAIIREIPEITDLCLVGRTEQRLETVADLFPNQRVRILSGDIVSPEGIAQMYTELPDPEDIDLVIIAMGRLCDSTEHDTDELSALMRVNLLAPQMWIEEFLREHRISPLSIAVIGSVAGDRVRASNYWYGTSKAGLEDFLTGVGAYAYQNHFPVSFTLIKPGLVDTPMIADRRDRRLVVPPSQAARRAVAAVRKGKRVVYTPFWWGFIMSIMKRLPYFIFRKIKY